MIGLKKILFMFMTSIVVVVGYVLYTKDNNLVSSQSSKETNQLPLSYKIPSYIQHSTCKRKKQSIFYIKIQKTGSTTVKSMLLNYALKHKLRICLDNTDIHHMNFPYRLDESKLIRFPDEPCEMIADELVFDKSQVLKLMSGRPHIIASVRDPIQHFLSMYQFSLVHHAVEMLTLLKLDFWDGVRIFLKNPTLVRSIYNTYKKDEIHDFALQHLVRGNLQTFSLGLSPTASKTEVKARSKEIDFFIVSEYFHESVVILAKNLCVPFNDLVFVQHNINHDTKKEQIKDAPSDVIELIKKFNSNDLILYDIALQRLDTSRTQYPDFKNDLNIYRSLIEKYARDCHSINKPLAMVDGNYCLPEVPTYFYEMIRNDVRKDLLSRLQDKYNKLNET